MRVGLGFDVHAFRLGRPLILGGVKIPFELGLAGHSDADVLSHAIADALLGAAGAYDIGFYFSDQDPAWADISSLVILQKVSEKIYKNGFKIANIDSVIMAQRPRLSPYIRDMRELIAGALTLSINQVAVKATTTESLGFVGREEGIAAQAICLLTS